MRMNIKEKWMVQIHSTMNLNSLFFLHVSLHETLLYTVSIPYLESIQIELIAKFYESATQNKIKSSDRAKSSTCILSPLLVTLKRSPCVKNLGQLFTKSPEIWARFSFGLPSKIRPLSCRYPPVEMVIRQVSRSAYAHLD